MTMFSKEKNSIWSRVREDRDVDDVIFGREREQEQDVVFSER